jgi:hypothetical protein
MTRARGFVALSSCHALMACASEPGSEMASRECLWVASASKYPAKFADQEIAVCGWIENHDGKPWLTDDQRPQWQLALSLPATSGGDPGLDRVLAALATGDGSAADGLEGRFHGRLHDTPGQIPTLVVRRVDWLDGRPR